MNDYLKILYEYYEKFEHDARQQLQQQAKMWWGLGNEHIQAYQIPKEERKGLQGLQKMW